MGTVTAVYIIQHRYGGVSDDVFQARVDPYLYILAAVCVAGGIALFAFWFYSVISSEAGWFGPTVWALLLSLVLILAAIYSLAYHKRIKYVFKEDGLVLREGYEIKYSSITRVRVATTPLPSWGVQYLSHYSIEIRHGRQDGLFNITPLKEQEFLEKLKTKLPDPSVIVNEEAAGGKNNRKVSYGFHTRFDSDEANAIGVLSVHIMFIIGGVAVCAAIAAAVTSEEPVVIARFIACIGFICAVFSNIIVIIMARRVQDEVDRHDTQAALIRVGKGRKAALIMFIISAAVIFAVTAFCIIRL